VKEKKTAAKENIEPKEPADNQPVQAAPAQKGEFGTAAADINNTLTVKPPLATDNEETAKKEIIALLGDIKEGDDLALTTWNTLKKLGWKTEKPTKVPNTRPPKTAKTPKSPKVLEDGNRKIKVDESKAPKREGTKAFARFAAYRKAKTVGNYVAGGGKHSDVSFDLYHKTISLV
jgi:hypothetical protein